MHARPLAKLPREDHILSYVGEEEENEIKKGTKVWAILHV
jgi:hypothetical protein